MALLLNMSNPRTDPLLQVETTCGSLLYELQIIWDEVGESVADRDKMLLELEKECLEVYRRKVDLANRSRAQLRQAIADAEAELAAICSATGERPVHIRQSVQNTGSLKEELSRILPQLEEMRKRKSERRNQFLEVQEQIQKISNEIYGSTEYISSMLVVDESDLSLRKLEELHRELHELQKEKSDRLRQVQEHVCALNSLCSVLGVDSKKILTEVHPSLRDSERSKNISNGTIEQLAAAIQKLREVKLQRMQRLQDLATTMLELWNLMDTPMEEQQMFQNVTCNIAASEHEITEPNSLSMDFINHVEAEVSRLEEFKSSKMKELVLKKRSELEEFCRKTHMVPEVDSTMEDVIDAIESGVVDPACLLEQIELQIANVKEEAFSRKELLEKVEKWLAACDEESWLEEYNRDENRYNAGRGAHLTLKRAEKARSLVNKLPAMVDALASKTLAWEKERGIEFTYDGIRLLSMLEEYTLVRQEKEQERRRQRDQKKLQGQLIAEQEALYGSKPSPSKTQGVKKAPRMSTGGASSKRLSLGGTMLHTPKPDPLQSAKATPHSRPIRKNDRMHQNPDQLNPQYDGISVLSAGRRGLDVAGLPVKKHSFGNGNVREGESPMMRIPFSPIISTAPSKANVANLLDDPNRTRSEKMQKTLPTKNLQFNTPSKTTSMADEENKTPKSLPIRVPTTPSTVSVPMQTAPTPAPAPLVSFGAKVVELIPEEIEYSFEERRAGFVLPKTHTRPMILQV
ncbi:65-kDa microtubule-associated protein 3-like [Juglans regia]|uniref:65-kDa microtubule-associated protein 3-like n=2 Tax=Juglans regia TaxID=51240 RepID=A0A2I4EET9_JUGRE|nr:65-kDa microtubule-associated protein 3-like [Juglans regia]